ncbi:MAG: ribonuclease P protein component [Prolixibacteraceae bacterium]|jgi:ribonuclease P protein component|nr:ribonuclease P protein component [Prolixibacteraceae bacterium]
MERFTLKKEERLCSRIIIEKLFSEGESFLSYPMKVVMLKTPLDSSFPVQSSFSVSKRNFKKAVWRNLIKRRMREAFRLNKNDLYEILKTENIQLAIMFVFIGKEIPDYREIEKGMRNAIYKIRKDQIRRK